MKCGCKGATGISRWFTCRCFDSFARKGREKKKKQICFPYDDAHFVRPKELKCDGSFQNAKDKWIAFVGLKDGRP